MARKIKVGVQRAFARAFDAEAVRRGLVVRREGHCDTSSAEYETDTALGTMRLSASGSPIILHVYRRFDDVDRAGRVLGRRNNFNPYSGKWNRWVSGELVEADATSLVQRVFTEIDGLCERINEGG